MTRGINDPHDYYYRRVFTDGVRAVEAALTRAETDPAQTFRGRRQSRAVAYPLLSPDFTPVFARLCPMFHSSATSRAPSASPRATPMARSCATSPCTARRPESAYETLNYFDGVHFAARTKAATLFSVGLMDDVCPPSTVYAAYNAWAGQKTIETYSFNNHEGGGTLAGAPAGRLARRDPAVTALALDYAERDGIIARRRFVYSRIAIYAVLAFFALIYLVPALLVFFNSFRNPAELREYGVINFPRSFSFDSYVRVGPRPAFPAPAAASRRTSSTR